MDTKKYERFKREMTNYDAALKSQQVKLYIMNQRLSRRIRAESEAIVQENEYLKKVTEGAVEALREAKVLMARREKEVVDLWAARQERIDHENSLCNQERKGKALVRGTEIGSKRAMRHSRKTFSETKKVRRRCKYHYEKVLVKRSKVVKKKLTDAERWDKFGSSVLKFMQAVIHLKEVVQHRKPQQKYSLSVSKLYQVELILEKLLTAARKEKLADCTSKITPIDQRMQASRTIMVKQLPRGCSEMKLLASLEEVAKDNANNIKRLKMLSDMNTLGKEELDKLKSMTRAERRALEISQASRAFAGSLLESSERTQRRLYRMNKRLYAGRERKERAALFVQAVWNYRKLKRIAFVVKRNHLITLSQCGYRRWRAIRVANAMRIQRWFKHYLWGEKQLYVVRAELRDRKRDQRKRDKVTRKLKTNFDKIWDVANDRYFYKHRKLPGVILQEKPKVLGKDDVLSPRSKRRRNWAQATGGREELNEIEAAHIIVKFMKLTTWKDAGGFIISQQWYRMTSWLLSKRPSKAQAVVIIQKIIRTQIERWGGLQKFGKRVSHNHHIMKRRLKAKKRGKGGAGAPMGILGADSRPLHPEVSMEIGHVYNPKICKEGYKERKKASLIQVKLERAEKIRQRRKEKNSQYSYETEKRVGWDSFFSQVMKTRQRGSIAKLIEMRNTGGSGFDKVNVSPTIRRSHAARKKEILKDEESIKREGWESMVKTRAQVFAKLSSEGASASSYIGENDDIKITVSIAKKVREYRNFGSAIGDEERHAKNKESHVDDNNNKNNARRFLKSVKFKDDDENFTGKDYRDLDEKDEADGSRDDGQDLPDNCYVVRRRKSNENVLVIKS